MPTIMSLNSVPEKSTRTQRRIEVVLTSNVELSLEFMSVMHGNIVVLDGFTVSTDNQTLDLSQRYQPRTLSFTECFI